LERVKGIEDLTMLIKSMLPEEVVCLRKVFIDKNN
jgi:hypothetical protein